MSLFYSFDFKIVNGFYLWLIAIIHDGAIRLENPRETSELWIRAVVDNLNVQCQSPIPVNIIGISSEIELNEELIKRNLLL